MTDRDRARIILAFLIPLAGGVFLLGISWGLPSRAVDPYLFGDHPVWSGEQISQLAGDRSGSETGADVDVNPVSRARQPILLNETDRHRAEIIRRYRLFTYQPDEMITMMSLASMKPGQGDFDPKLYQYGGLWIYPVGALLKLAGIISSQTHYLDHPEEFGRFYLIARLYTVMWGLLGVWAIFRLAYNSGGGLIGATGAALLYMFLPVVVDLSHEAKPHLPGVVLVLLAALAAGRFIRDGKERWWIVTGILCGAAAGMILSCVLAILILPAMALMRPMPNQRRIRVLFAAGAISVGIYFLANPYVLIHLLGDRTVLVSNLSNSAAMYGGGWGKGILNGVRLIAEGATPLVSLIGLLGTFILLRKTAKPQAVEIWALLVVAIVVIVQFVLLAAGKPGEYGRFAILPDIVLALCASVAIGGAKIRNFEKVQAIGLLCVLAILPSAIYLHGFIRDSGPFPRRIEYARDLAAVRRLGASSIGIYRDPAPYLLPPVDLFSWKILLLPQQFELESGKSPVDVIVRPVDKLAASGQRAGAYVQISQRVFDDIFPAQISWAAKPIEIWVRAELIDVVRPSINE